MKSWALVVLFMVVAGMLAGCDGSKAALVLPEQMVVELGKTTQLEPGVLQGKQPLEAEARWEVLREAGLVWTSSDTDVAHVDEDGLLTCAAPGRAEIQVVSGDGKLKASMTIEVIVPLQRADIPAELILQVGSSRELEVLPVPAEATAVQVRYASSDPEVAEVDEEGRVNAIGLGSCVVTVTVTGDALTGEQEFGYSTKVRVVEPLAALGFVADDGLAWIGDEWDVSVYRDPSDAPVELRYSTSDESKAVFKGNGLVYFLEAGTVTLRVEDLVSGLAAELPVTIRAVESAPLWSGNAGQAQGVVEAPVVQEDELTMEEYERLEAEAQREIEMWEEVQRETEAEQAASAVEVEVG